MGVLQGTAKQAQHSTACRMPHSTVSTGKGRVPKFKPKLEPSICAHSAGSSAQVLERKVLHSVQHSHTDCHSDSLAPASLTLT